MRAVDKLDKLDRGAGPRPAGRGGRAHRRAGRQLPGAGPDQHAATPPSSSRCARSAYTTSCWTRGSTSSPPSSRAAPPLVTDRVEIVADLKIARGLDYYTGTVFETRLEGYESLGSICSGGRYDALATDGRTTYPGVGISLGVSRVLVPLLGQGVVTADRSVPSAVLVAVVDEESRAGQRRPRRAAARQRRALRGRAGGPEVRQADPARRAPRHPLRSLPGRRRRAARRSRTSAAATRPRSTSPRGRLPSRTCVPASPPTFPRSNSSDPHPRRRQPAVHRRRQRGHPRRLGGAPPRPRGRGLHRPARGQRGRPGGHPRRGGGAQPAQRVLPEGHRHRLARAPRATRTPTCPRARSR